MFIQVFVTSQLPIRSLDFSQNSIRRLPDKAFSGIEVRIWWNSLTEDHLNCANSINFIFTFASLVCEFESKKPQWNFFPSTVFLFSYNNLRYIKVWLFSSSLGHVILQTTLIVLKLSDNLFGDSLNPIFSTAEFRPLIQLRILDLSGNKIKALEEGIFKGCEKLQVNRNKKKTQTTLYLLSLPFILAFTAILRGFDWL